MSWLIIDTENVCNRIFYGICKGDAALLVKFTLRAIESYLETLSQVENTIFCFDDCKEYCVRTELYPDYKSSRKNKIYTPDEFTKKNEFVGEVRRLKEEILPACGFKNIFSQRGYEADDLIAEAKNRTVDAKIVIISSDKDLYQLLDKRTRIWHPFKGFFTHELFYQQRGISPSRWPFIKAIAGDRSDGIRGAELVAETTALKYETDRLPKLGAQYRKIKRFIGSSQYVDNYKLVKLPYEGCELSHPPEPDALDRGKLREYIHNG